MLTKRQAHVVNQHELFLSLRWLGPEGVGKRLVKNFRAAKHIACKAKIHPKLV